MHNGGKKKTPKGKQEGGSQNANGTGKKRRSRWCWERIRRAEIKAAKRGNGSWFWGQSQRNEPISAQKPKETVHRKVGEKR